MAGQPEEEPTIRENFTGVTDFRKPKRSVTAGVSLAVARQRSIRRRFPVIREIDPQDCLLRGERNYSVDYTVVVDIGPRGRYRRRFSLFLLSSSPPISAAFFSPPLFPFSSLPPLLPLAPLFRLSASVT